MQQQRALTPANAVDFAILARRSIRQFLPKPVPTSMVMDILEVAARSPSGHNTQPWKVHVLTGPALRRLSDAILLECRDPLAADKHRPVFDAYPVEWISPFIDRRRQVGKDMYTLLGIPKGDRIRMREQAHKNYAFFGAPVGLLFTLHQIMVPGSVLDLGIFLQSVMLAAKSRGLDTCPQAALANFHEVARAQLALGAEQVLICGMSMGHADPDAPINQVVTHRERASTFTAVHET